ncbi:MAG TPA: CopD family protein [Gammaproteobacteria bacterium]
MPVVAITLHILAVIVWVGGMFFAYLAARPVLAELETLLRARIWAGFFGRFFPWVWATIVALLASGIYMVFNSFDGFANAPLFVNLMMGLGVLMMALFGHINSAPYPRLKRAVEAKDAEQALKAMGQIRRVMGLNLALGIVVVLIAMSGAYLSSD